MSLLSVIIVNYKTPQLTVDCLKTVYAQNHENLEVIVVDNYSQDNSRDFILSNCPAVKWIQMEYNSGFARANNAGIRQSSGDTVLLLNSDTLNTGDAINNCYREFRSSSYIACGVQLLNSDGSPQISGSYFMKGSLNNLLPLPYVGKAVKLAGTLFKVRKPHADDSHKIVEVDWINGAFLMVKKEAIDKVGLMDEDFFLYAEEAEWCHRLGEAGKMVIFGHYEVVHLQGESSNEAFNSSGQGYYNLYDKKGLQIMLSNFVRIRKQWGIGWFLFHLLAYTITVPVYFVLQFVEAILRFKPAVISLRKWGGFTKNVCRVWKYLPLILSNRPHFYKVL